MTRPSSRPGRGSTVRGSSVGQGRRMTLSRRPEMADLSATMAPRSVYSRALEDEHVLVGDLDDRRERPAARAAQARQRPRRRRRPMSHALIRCSTARSSETVTIRPSTVGFRDNRPRARIESRRPTVPCSGRHHLATGDHGPPRRPRAANAPGHWRPGPLAARCRRPRRFGRDLPLPPRTRTRSWDPDVPAGWRALRAAERGRAPASGSEDRARAAAGLAHRGGGGQRPRLRARGRGPVAVRRTRAAGGRQRPSVPDGAAAGVRGAEAPGSCAGGGVMAGIGGLDGTGPPRVGYVSGIGSP